jgi:hypothetical protein
MLAEIAGPAQELLHKLRRGPARNFQGSFVGRQPHPRSHEPFHNRGPAAPKLLVLARLVIAAVRQAECPDQMLFFVHDS